MARSWLAFYQVALFAAEKNAERHEVQPGITGWTLGLTHPDQLLVHEFLNAGA